MDAVLKMVIDWCGDHTAIVAIVVGFVCLAVPNTLFVKAGFFFSQLLRKIGGQKLEEKAEKLVEGFEQGMKGDNPGKK